MLLSTEQSLDTSCSHFLSYFGLESARKWHKVKPCFKQASLVMCKFTAIANTQYYI